MISLMRNILWQLYFLLSSWLGFSQSIESETIADLPSGLNECSGMVFIDDHRIAMVNDGGNKAEVFIVDTNGQLLEKIPLPALENVDWESMAISDTEIFIGDFGNNGNGRRDLAIYALDKESWELNRKIEFYYPDQADFPALAPDRYYDLEAMLFRNDSLLLIIKNRTEPFDGKLRVYSLNPKLDEQAASLLQEFKHGKGMMHFNWVCGASRGLKSNDLFLIGYQNLWYWPNFNANSAPESLRFDLGYWSQKEALAYQQGYIYFTEESHFTRAGKLHRASVGFLEKFQSGKPIMATLDNKHFKDSLGLKLSNAPAFEGAQIQVYNRDGSISLLDTIRNAELNSNKVHLELGGISKGSHLLSISRGAEKQVFLIYKD